MMNCTETSTEGFIGPITKALPEEVIFATSLVMGRIRQKLEIAADPTIAVLLRGHSGTGKEVPARLLHSLPPWRNGAFVKFS
jgi:DNA-binding NtrC family response regulator